MYTTTKRTRPEPDSAVPPRSSKKANGVIERCYFGNNEVESRYGGAIAQSSGENMWIINSTIVDNKAFYEGAGVCANGSSLMTMYARYILLTVPLPVMPVLPTLRSYMPRYGNRYCH